MEIVSFQEAYLEGAAAVAYAHWGREHRHADAATRRLIYRYLVRYYFHPDSPFSLAAVEGERVCGMLLAHRKSDAPFPASTWLAAAESPENRAVLTEYTAYLDGNRKKESPCLLQEKSFWLFWPVRSGGAGGC